MNHQNTTTMSFRSFRWSMATGLFMLLAGTAFPAMLPDAKPVDFPADPAKHVIRIQRDAADDARKKLIAVAEAAAPDAAALKKAANGEVLAKDEVQWWHGETLGIRIPFAVTGAGVEYYRKLVEGYGKQAFKRCSEPSSKLDYQAGVVFHKEFEHQGKTYRDVHVVTLKLSFSQQFAASETEGMEFEKQRTVILNAEGKVLAISGDGPTEVAVMAI
jgi:hypothetical protein